VKGALAKLFRVDGEEYVTAIEVTGGGKLYNIVVQDEKIASMILKQKLGRRITFIPLNKISTDILNNDVIKQAEKLVGSENVTLALALIQFDKEVEPAMKYAFGKTLICKDSDVAKKVSSQKNCKVKCVTLDGDIFDPSGTLTGGSRKKGESILLKVEKMLREKQELHSQEMRLDEVIKKLAMLREKVEKYRELDQERQVQKHKLDLINNRLKQSIHHQLLEKSERIAKSIGNIKNIFERFGRKKTNCP